MTATPVVGAREGGSCGQHLMMEVAPTQLPDKARGAGFALSARDRLRRRQTAEMKVGREARGLVAREIVVMVFVAFEARAQPPAQALASLRLSSRGQLRRDRACNEGERESPFVSPEATGTSRGACNGVRGGSALHLRK